MVTLGFRGKNQRFPYSLFRSYTYTHVYTDTQSAVTLDFRHPCLGPLSPKQPLNLSHSLHKPKGYGTKGGDDLRSLRNTLNSLLEVLPEVVKSTDSSFMSYFRSRRYCSDIRRDTCRGPLFWCLSVAPVIDPSGGTTGTQTVTRWNFRKGDSYCLYTTTVPRCCNWSRVCSTPRH